MQKGSQSYRSSHFLLPLLTKTDNGKDRCRILDSMWLDSAALKGQYVIFEGVLVKYSGYFEYSPYLQPYNASWTFNFQLESGQTRKITSSWVENVHITWL